MSAFRRIPGRTHRCSRKNRSSLRLMACMARYETTRYPNLASAREAEMQAIRAEQPLFNLQERRQPTGWSMNDVADYLITHGHAELAVATACTCSHDEEKSAPSPWCVAHEYVRFQTGFRSADHVWKISNNWTSRIARDLIKRNPEWRAHIETRALAEERGAA